MPLPTPILDNRSWQELRDDLVRRIPVYNPEWTDHNASDPGITLIELFAFLGENLLFRFNQIPEATRLAFLRLLGIPLRAATPAAGLLELATRLPTGDLVPLASEARAGDVAFETVQEVDVLPLEALVLIKRLSAGPSTSEERTFTAATELALGRLDDNERVVYYQAAQLLPPDHPDARPLEAQHAVDGMIWVAVLSTKQTDERQLRDRILNIGFVPDEEVASMDEVSPCRGASGDPPPAVLWQASTKTKVARSAPEYLRLDVIADSSEGLTRTGVVRLQLPKDVATLGLPDDVDQELVGADESPPTIEDPQLAARVLFWIRAGRTRDRRPFRPIVWMGVNATQVVQLQTSPPEFLGVGTGQPYQSCTLVHPDAVPGSVRLEVEESGEWRAWEEVERLDASRRDDRHYTLDAEAGIVRFGNSSSGRPPQAGERIRVREYRYGGGTRGNVAPKAVSRLPALPSVKASNPLRTSGGADAERLDEALDRVPGEVRRRDRAVTASDFEELAIQTPGAMIARAETMPLFHPPTRRQDAAGVVTVVVWPREDPRHPNAPVPDRAVLRKVCNWLDTRRLITTELWVVPPTYRKIAVAVGLQVKPGYGVEAVRRWVELVVRQYLAPLPPFGPEGKGWPLGRRVHGPELEAAVLQVEGVAFLEGDLRVAAWDPDASRWGEPGRVAADGSVRGATIELLPWEVPELWEITVVEGTTPLEPGTAVGPVLPLPGEDPPPLPGTADPGAGRLPRRPGVSTGSVPPGVAANRPLPLPVPVPVPKTEC